MASFPQGTRAVLIVGADGMARPTGMAQMPGGQMCGCNTPTSWVAKPAGSYDTNKFVLLSPSAQVDLQRQGGSLNSTYSRVDMPNRGSVGVSRLEGNGSPSEGNQVFTLTLNNIGGATAARQFIGDYVGTYSLLGNLELNPAGFVIAGTWGTNSKTQFIGRAFARPLKVKKIQFIANDETFFNLSQTFYFDTKPTANSPVKDNLSLTSLLSPTSFNNKIQFYDNEIRFDGINGLDVTIPAGQSITLQFTIVSEASATEQVLVS